MDINPMGHYSSHHENKILVFGQPQHPFYFHIRRTANVCVERKQNLLKFVARNIKLFGEFSKTLAWIEKQSTKQ